MEEGERWRNAREAHNAQFDSARLDSDLSSRTVGKKEVYYTMGSPVYKTTMTAWPAFFGLGEKRKEKR